MKTMLVNNLCENWKTKIKDINILFFKKFATTFLSWTLWITRDVCKTLMPPSLGNICEENEPKLLQIIEIF